MAQRVRNPLKTGVRGEGEGKNKLRKINEKANPGPLSY